MPLAVRWIAGRRLDLPTDQPLVFIGADAAGIIAQVGTSPRESTPGRMIPGPVRDRHDRPVSQGLALVVRTTASGPLQVQQTN